jgi:hypothetical protein
MYVSWSILAGQSHGQWGPEFPGMLQFSLRPGIVNYFLAGSAAEFSVNLAVASHFFFFSFSVVLLNFIHMHIYIEVVILWSRASKSWVGVVYVLLFVLQFGIFLED